MNTLSTNSGTRHTAELDKAAQALTDAGGGQASYVWDPDPASFSLEMLKSFYAHWSDLPTHPGSGFALVSSFDVVGFSDVISYLIYVDVVDEGRDFFYRVYGGGIAQFSGFDLTGQYLSKSHPPASSRKFMLESYRAVLRHGLPMHTIHSPPKDFLIATWSRFIVPLAQDDGQIARLLLCNVPTLTREGLEPVRSVYGTINAATLPR